MYRFQVFKRVGMVLKTKFYFRFRSPNGRIMMQSQGYTDKDNVYDAIETLKREAADAVVEEVDE